MFDKLEDRCKLGWKSCYAMLDYKRQHHHERFKRFIEAMPKKLLCQECSGIGEYLEETFEGDYNLYYECGWCEGTGYVTPHLRGLWLRFKRTGQ